MTTPATFLHTVVTEKVPADLALRGFLHELVASRDKASVEAVIAAHRKSTMTPP